MGNGPGQLSNGFARFDGVLNQFFKQLGVFHLLQNFSRNGADIDGRHPHDPIGPVTGVAYPVHQPRTIPLPDARQHWPVLITGSRIRNGDQQQRVCLIVSGGALQFGISRVAGSVRKCPGDIDVPDHIITRQQVLRHSWRTCFTCQVRRVRIAPRRTGFLRIQGAHAYIVVTRINALNGETLSAAHRYIYPVAVILAPLSLIPDCTVNAIPGRIHGGDRQPLLNMISLSDDDIFRRRNDANRRDGHRRRRNAHTVIDIAVFIRVMLNSSDRESTVAVVVRPDGCNAKILDSKIIAVDRPDGTRLRRQPECSADRDSGFVLADCANRPRLAFTVGQINHQAITHGIINGTIQCDATPVHRANTPAILFAGAEWICNTDDFCG